MPLRSVANYSDLRVFASFGIQLRDPAARRARGFANSFARKTRGRRECGVLAAPAVSCAKMCKRTHTSIQVQAGATRHSLRNGLTAYGAISPAIRICLSPSPPRKMAGHPVGPASPPKGLTPTMRRQDHAFLPYAAARLRQGASPGTARLGTWVQSGIGAGRPRAVAAHGPKPALPTRHAPDAAASTATRPNVRDDGQRPSTGTGWREVVEVIWGWRQGKFRKNRNFVVASI
jgi:hypothetical protein